MRGGRQDARLDRVRPGGARYLHPASRESPSPLSVKGYLYGS